MRQNFSQTQVTNWRLPILGKLGCKLTMPGSNGLSETKLFYFPKMGAFNWLCDFGSDNPSSFIYNISMDKPLWQKTWHHCLYFTTNKSFVCRKNFNLNKILKESAVMILKLVGRKRRYTLKIYVDMLNNILLLP